MSCTYRPFREEDEASVDKLLKTTFPSFRKENMWNWKYKLNPSFDSSLVVVAEKDNEIIGSNYWMLRDIKLQNDLKIKAALGADVAVNPSYRGQGVGTQLIRYPRSSGVFREHNILLSYMFGRPELKKNLYAPAGGYIVAPNSTTTYRKLFTCKQLQEKFQEIDQAIGSNEIFKKELRNLKMCICFKAKGAPEFSVQITPMKVYLTEGKAIKPDVIIEGRLPLSSLAINGTLSSNELVKALFTGKFRVKKGLFHIFKVRRAFKLFQKALKMKSQSQAKPHT